MSKIFISNKKTNKNSFQNQNMVAFDEVPSVFSDDIFDFIKEKNKNRESFCKEVADITDKGVELWVLKDFLMEYCDPFGSRKLKKSNSKKCPRESLSRILRTGEYRVDYF